MNTPKKDNSYMSQRGLLRGILTQEFKDKEVLSTNDKRRIIRDVLGYAPNFSSMKTDEYEKVIEHVKQRTADELKSKIIVWAYMVELEDGLTKGQINKLLQLIPSDIELFPFTLNEGVTLSANSMAIGFINNDYYEDLGVVKQSLSRVCNDWEHLSEDNTYILSNDKIAFMLSD